MEERKMTAVQWLEELFNRGAYRETIKEAFKHAKQIEKEQIGDAWDSAYGGDSFYSGESYYNETYKSE